MIFFITAAGVMALLIVIIHKLAGRFGCELPLSSLIICGICAIIINFVIISVTPFLTNAYYYTAGLMILFAAFGTTCYNKYSLSRKIRLADGASLSSAELKEDAAQDAQREQAAAETDAAPVSDTDTTADAGTDININATADADADIDSNTASSGAKADVNTAAGINAGAAAEADANKNTDAAAKKGANTNTNINANVYAADVPAPVGRLSASPAGKAGYALKASAPESTGKDTGRRAEAAAAKNADHKQKPVPPAAAKQKDNSCKKTAAGRSQADILSVMTAMTTMDQLLDFAFEQNMQQHKQVALTAYETALTRYRDDSYAPFIVVSIANIHKEQGNYRAAINSIQSAMDIPALRENDSIKKQFRDTLSYLTITEDVLQKAGLGDISFKDIPKEHMSQIESIYNSRKSR